MEGRTALIAAIVAGCLAVAIVAADLQFGWEAELQVQEDGEWVAAATKDESYIARAPGFACAGQDVRLVVENNGLFSIELPVSLYYHTRDGEQVVELDDTWTLERGAIESRAFRVPDSAFAESTDPNGSKIVPNSLSVSAMVGNVYLSTCVQLEDSA